MNIFDQLALIRLEPTDRAHWVIKLLYGLVNQLGIAAGIVLISYLIGVGFRLGSGQ